MESDTLFSALALAERSTNSGSPPSQCATGERPGNVFWDVVLRASGKGTFLIERADVRLLDATGAVVGETHEFWSRSAGCSVCTTDFTIEGGRAAQFSGKSVRYVGGGAPVRFTYTVFYSDSVGPGQTGVEVPVR